MERRPNRRYFLAAVGAGTIGLAGCTDAADDLPNSDGGNGSTTGGGNGSDGSDERQATPPAIDHGELLSDFDGDIEEWFAHDGELTADEEAQFTGSRTARIEGEGASAGIARSFPDGLDVEGRHLSLALRVDDPRPTRVTVRLLAPGQSDQLWSTRTVLDPYEGWQRMDVGYTGQRGEPFLDNVQEIRITLEDSADDQGGEGDKVRFFVDDLRTTPAANQGYVMLTFDDGVRSQYDDAFPLFEERDMQGVASVVPGSLNRESRLTIDQLREMRDAGWDISSHPDPGTGLTEVDPEEARNRIESDSEYLDNRGFPDGAVTCSFHITTRTKRSSRSCVSTTS